MTAIEQLVGEFIDDWNAGRRPDVATYLERAAPENRDVLASQLETWLDLAPTPVYDEPTRQSIAREPILMAALDAATEVRGPLAERLPTLRDRADLGIRDVAARLTQLFELGDEQRTAAYLEQIERDELDERRLSRRLLDALATILGANADRLAPSPAALAGGQAFFRAEEDADVWIAKDIDVLSGAALSPAPATPMDELDRLFLGGPDA